MDKNGNPKPIEAILRDIHHAVGLFIVREVENEEKALRHDYAKMAGMIYGERPDFDDLMTEIAKIEAKINSK